MRSAILSRGSERLCLRLGGDRAGRRLLRAEESTADRPAGPKQQPVEEGLPDRDRIQRNGGLLGERGRRRLQGIDALECFLRVVVDRYAQVGEPVAHVEGDVASGTRRAGRLFDGRGDDRGRLFDGALEKLVGIVVDERGETPVRRHPAVERAAERVGGLATDRGGLVLDRRLDPPAQPREGRGPVERRRRTEAIDRPLRLVTFGSERPDLRSASRGRGPWTSAVRLRAAASRPDEGCRP